MAKIVVRDEPEQSRYAVVVDGEEAGGAYYELRGNRVVFTHTEIDSKWEGKGVGSALAKAALNDVRETGRTAVPRCPFIAGYIRKHQQYLDIVDRPHRASVTA